MTRQWLTHKQNTFDYSWSFFFFWSLILHDHDCACICQTTMRLRRELCITCMSRCMYIKMCFLLRSRFTGADFNGVDKDHSQVKICSMYICIHKRIKHIQLNIVAFYYFHVKLYYWWLCVHELIRLHLYWTQLPIMGQYSVMYIGTWWS